MKRVSIKDVAKEAGVSITTVSHSLSGRGVIKQETRDRVIEIAKRMNYIPDWNGRNLKAVATRTIGLFTKSIRGYYGQLADAMSEECKVHGYELDIFVTDDEQMMLSSLISHRVDGAVILHSGLTDQSVEMLIRAEVPVLFLDREIQGKTVSSVLFDSYATGQMAAKYLHQLGHRRILFVEGQDTYDGIMRRRGFMEYMKTIGEPIPEEYQIDGWFDRGVANKAMKEFLSKGLPLPDAIFATNDDSAFGCIKALLGAGYKVPEDVSVMGVDDIELSRWYAPSLTTIRTHIDQQGQRAAKEVIRLVNGHSGTSIRIQGDIVERKSCRQKS
ncbi:MAG: LacI family DNA-binding transcriptional regulator [Lachnospiraceae bacterium]|nr:LacI family DNA-binding transcriptional regulator [Lachnospiraceae bacterium]